MEKKNNRMLLLALALSMSVGIQSAQAVDVGDDWLPYLRWDSLREAIMEGTDPTINFVGDIEPNIDRENITAINSALSELTINGNNYSLAGRGEGSGPITVAANQILNINNLNQSQFGRFLENHGTANITGGSFNNNATQVVYNHGTLHISGTTISNNHGSTNQDAAIFNNGGDVYINGGTFSGNTAFNGAAIVNSNGTVVIIKTFFSFIKSKTV